MGNKKDINHIEHEMNEIMGLTSPPAIEEAKRLLHIKQNHLSIRKDAYIGDPYSLLGEVIIIRKEGGQCPGKFISENNPEFYELPIQIEINDESKIKEPVTVSSFIVDKGLSMGIDALNYLSAELDQKSAFSVIVTNQAAGLVKVQADGWRTSLKEWKEENKNLYADDNICYILAVTGFVQKNILRKKYFKLEENAKGGAFGINLNGKVYTSTEDYALDTILGLDVRVLKYPSFIFKSDNDSQLTDILDVEPSNEQLSLFKTIASIKSNKNESDTK